MDDELGRYGATNRELRRRVIQLEWQVQQLEQRHERLLDQIERWNDTIAVGTERAKLAEAVIKAAQELDEQVLSAHSGWGLYFQKLHQALTEYTPTTPWPEPLKPEQ